VRALAWIILATGTMLVSAPGHAQTYNPSYPVCAQLWDIQGGYIECAYLSLAQCSASVSGRAGMCLINPFVPPANISQPYAGRPRRHAAR
jgi:hypothetical protein